jgi:hypothetical protein
VPVRTQWGQRLQPLRGHPVFVALALFRFRRFADLALYFGVPHYDKSPGLLIGAAGSQRGAANRVLKQLERDRLRRKATDRAPRCHTVHELARLLQLLRGRHTLKIQEDVLVGLHNGSVRQDAQDILPLPIEFEPGHIRSGVMAGGIEVLPLFEYAAKIDRRL